MFVFPKLSHKIQYATCLEQQLLKKHLILKLLFKTPLTVVCEL